MRSRRAWTFKWRRRRASGLRRRQDRPHLRQIVLVEQLEDVGSTRALLLTRECRAIERSDEIAEFVGGPSGGVFDLGNVLRVVRQHAVHDLDSERVIALELRFAEKLIGGAFV